MGFRSFLPNLIVFSFFSVAVTDFLSCVLVYKKINNYAGVMELADVTDSKSVGGNTVRVRPPPPAP